MEVGYRRLETTDQAKPWLRHLALSTGLSPLEGIEAAGLGSAQRGWGQRPMCLWEPLPSRGALGRLDQRSFWPKMTEIHILAIFWSK